MPDYKPPFEAELGPSITNEHIREYVARQKMRPGFPDVWKHNHPVSGFQVYSFLLAPKLSCRHLLMERICSLMGLEVIFTNLQKVIASCV